MAFGWDDLIGLILAGSQVGSLFGGSGFQERNTFEGEKRGNLSLDPRDLLGLGLVSTGRVGDLMEDRLNEDISLPGAYAQAPPTFTGGGLPMPIGVTGRDPAVVDPNTHLKKPGLRRRDYFLSTGSAWGDPLNPGGTSQPDPTGSPTPPPGGTDVDDTVDETGTWHDRKRGQDMMGEAQAAIDLLTGGRR